jgi:DNA-binding NarL/FixJ family response regulator
VKDGRSPLHISLENGQLSSFVSGVSSRLTEREQNVLSLVAQGITIEQIASQLSFSNTTVKRIIRQTIEKLNVRNRSEAVARAIKENLI